MGLLEVKTAIFNLTDEERDEFIAEVKPCVEQAMMGYSQWASALVRDIQENERNPSQATKVQQAAVKLAAALFDALCTLDKEFRDKYDNVFDGSNNFEAILTLQKFKDKPNGNGEQPVEVDGGQE